MQNYVSYSNPLIKAEYYTYDYPNTTTRNYSMKKYFQQDGTPGIVTEYVYDTKKLPSFRLLTSQAVTDNNVIKSTSTEANVATVTNYTYEYNSNGYPTKKTYAVGKETVVETFSYDCH